jgi:prepilin-type processing-associated H-X9-DG protein
MKLYAHDNRDALHPTPPNRGNWLTKFTLGPRVYGSIYKSSNGNAYWGVAYLKYLTKVNYQRYEEPAGADYAEVAAAIDPVRTLFHCPSVRYMDSDLSGGPFADNNDEFKPSYGLNSYVAEAQGPRPTRLSFFRNHSVMIVAQDHVEHKMDTGANGGDDNLARFGAPKNLMQWRYPSPNYWVLPESINEIFRHRKRCNVVFLDGHVQSIYRDSLDGYGQVTEINYVGRPWP